MRQEEFRDRRGIAIRMMFQGGADKVIIPTNENVLGLPDAEFDPMDGVILTDPDQADLVQKNIQFLPNRTLLTSAHLQGTNKLGTSDPAPFPDVALMADELPQGLSPHPAAAPAA